MSSPAVLDRPQTEGEKNAAWIELDEPVIYASQEAMREAPRYYTARQSRFIDEAVAARQPLPYAPLPLDD